MVTFSSFANSVFLVKSVQFYPAVFLLCFISAAVIVPAFFALMMQFSVPYNRTGRISVLCSFIIVFFNVFSGLNIPVIMPVIFK